MKHILALLISLIFCVPAIAWAQRYNNDFVGRPVTEALAEFCKKNPGLNINFIYDELQDYKVKDRALSDEPLEILKSIVALNPVSVTYDGDIIFIEAMQKGKYKYTGRTIDRLSGEPVSYATVMLLNPKDSTTITYGITDDNGNFSIPCDSRKVLARFSSVGYKTGYLQSPAFSMGKVMMDEQSVKLKGITMTAEARYALSDRTIYLPTVRERRAADNGINLLRFMAIPSLRISPSDNAVTTLSGGGVAFFIDNVRATAEEIQGMRPEDVKKVEILDYPADPRFEGVAHAVNFILTKYEYGGYTKLSAQQQVLIPDYGYYNLSSKFSKGKMTYDLFTGIDHFHSDHEKNEGSAVYDFSGEEVEWRHTMPKAKIENNEIYVSGRIKYASEKSVVSNQLSLRYDNVPYGRFDQENTYTPSIYPQGLDKESHKRSSLTPSWRGNWQFSLPRQYRLVVTPSAKYSRNTSNTFFSENGIENVSNVREDAWNADLGLGVSKSWKHHSLTFTLNGGLADNKLRYTGSNPADVHYSNHSAGGSISGNFKFGKLRIQPSVRYSWRRTSLDKEEYAQSLPGYYISGGVNFSRKHQFGFSSELSHRSIDVAYLSPNLVVKNLLDAVKGNPKLKAWLYNDVEFTYTWIPLQKFYLSAFAGYARHTRPLDYRYTPADINGREMMVRTYVREGYFQYFSEGVSASLRLLDNSLTLEGEGRVKSYRKGGRSPFNRTVVNGSVGANWFVGNFYVRGSFEFAGREVTQFERVFDQPCYYLVAAGWSSKGLRISAQLNNPFRSDFKKLWTYKEYENYSAKTDYFGTAYRRNIWINVSYTFHYGKKLKEDSIDKGSSASSAIVR